MVSVETPRIAAIRNVSNECAAAETFQQLSHKAAEDGTLQWLIVLG
jgi:hypothetical protein